ncbi:MAG: tRNA (guanosine(37)-N1)-methyltransferase TrmD [Rhodobacteraceae bacterium]|nr:tRNA (guanosine(37)-N1)-methyltransferase TrmD [Paracoccaceae bacterium]
MSFRATVLTLFPELFPGPLGASLLGKALEEDRWALQAVDFRDFASNKHRTVDDTPAGGGPGLVMRADIAASAIDHALAEGFEGASPPPVLYLSPRGRPFTQRRAAELAAGPGVILVCGRFEGLDQRAIEAREVEEICVGDAVYTGGEIPAMAVLDATIRLLPGVIGAPESLVEESFAAGLLEHPHYTRPRLWEDQAIPEVLLSGDHAKIAAWRGAQSQALTQERRPDLWAAHLRGQAPAEQSDASMAAETPLKGDE